MSISENGSMSGATFIHTPQGEFTIKELTMMNSSSQIFPIYSYNGKRVVKGQAFNSRLVGENIRIYEVVLKRGIIKLTENSRLMLENGKYRTVKNLEIGDLIKSFKDDFNPILEVKYIGRGEAYQLSVKKYHNFLANGIFIHNTFI